MRRPRARSRSIAAEASLRELTMEPKASGSERAVSKLWVVKRVGMMERYHAPVPEKAVRTTPMCGRRATAVTMVKAAATAIPAARGRGRSLEAREALAYI